jgi:hypothetical protein
MLSGLPWITNRPNLFFQRRTSLFRILALGYVPPGFVKGIFLFTMLMCFLAISTLLLLPSTLVGRIAARGGSRRDGDIAMAVFASYVIGQFMPLFY